MNILEPNNGKDTQPIYKNNVFVAVTDYDLILLLREVRIKFGEAHSKWMWINLKEGDLITVGSGEKEYGTFNEAINRMVNDPYCTVYEFRSYSEMMSSYAEGEVTYKDTITTIYKGTDTKE